MSLLLQLAKHNRLKKIMNLRQTNPLFDPISLGGRSLSHRVVMAPMTRTRADDQTLSPTSEIATYYAQRASNGGLLISEAVHISPEATPVWNIYSAVREQGGNVSGIWTETQTENWANVVQAVHAKGALISCQLLHTGRIAQPDITRHPLVQGQDVPLPPVSSSATPVGRGNSPGDYTWDQPATCPRALEADEIARVVEDYRRAAQNAFQAGFDFVEIHAAHGYLIDQFLNDGVNKRTDRYGGTASNQCRFLLEVVEAVGSLKGFDRVSVRLSPTNRDPVTGQQDQVYFDVTDSDPRVIYSHAINQLDDYELAYLLLTEPRVGGLSADPGASVSAVVKNSAFRQMFKGPLIGAGGFTPETAQSAIMQGHYDLIAFGRWFISNPDLPARLRLGAPLNVYDRPSFYGGGAGGYTDYPDLTGTMGVPGKYTLMDQRDVGTSLLNQEDS